MFDRRFLSLEVLKLFGQIEGIELADKGCKQNDTHMKVTDSLSVLQLNL